MTVAQVETVAAALAGRPGPRRLGLRRPDRRHRPRPDPADDRGARRRSPPSPSSSCSGPARARCSTSARPSEVGVHIITVTPDLLAKMASFGKDLDQFSLETVQMFHDDAARRGLHAVSDSAGARLNADGTDQDDWDDHWDTYGEAAKGNPANDYRHAMVLKLLGALPTGAVVLDIGSGQGQFAVDLQATNPQTSRSSASSTAPRASAGPSRSPRATGVPAHVLRAQPARAGDPRPPSSRRRPTRSAPRCSSTSTTRSPLMRNAVALLAPGAKVVVTVPGRPALGVRQAHRPLPALHRAGAAPGADRGRPRRRPGAAHRLPVLQPLQAGRRRPRREAGRRHGAPRRPAPRPPASRRPSPASSSAPSRSTATTRGSAGSWPRSRTSRWWAEPC